MRGMRLVLRHALTLCVVASGSACSVLKPIVPPVLQPAAAAASAPVRANAAPSFETEVDAPEPLRALLVRHMDLVRLASLSRGESVGQGELRRLIEAAPQQARELLQTEGYFQADVQVQLPPPVPGQTPRVQVRVRPGEAARVAELTLQFKGPLQAAAEAGDEDARAAIRQARAGFGLARGQVFRNATWAGEKSALLGRLRADAYAAATYAQSDAEVDAATGRVQLQLLVDSGPLFRTGAIVVEGLKKHDMSTVLNMAGFGAGAPLTEARLLDYQERLQKSGLFAGVTMSHDTEPARASAATLTVRVNEQVLQQLTLGVGFSDTSGPRAQVEWIDRRAFGWAASTRQKVEWARLKQDWQGEISTHPGPRMWRNFAGAEVERLLSSSDVVRTQSLRLGRAQDRQRIERSFFIEAERSTRSSPTQAFVPTDIDALSINGQGTWRDLDNPLLPTQGLVASAQLGLGRTVGAGRSEPFTRLYGRVTGYLPLGAHWYSQARIEAGRVLGSSGAALPEGQLFRAGGDDSVRGYGFRSLGVVRAGVLGGGRVMFTSSLELARPVSATLPSLWGAVFVDAGNVADSWSELKPAIGAGIGVRWRSPIGPLRADWAYGRDLGRARLHISLGLAF